MNDLIRTLLVQDTRSNEDGGIEPQNLNRGILLAYKAIWELEGYNLSDIIRKNSVLCID